MKSFLILALGVLIGYVTGRWLPPAMPERWETIEEGMPFSKVYELIPELEGSLREVKGFDVLSAETGSGYWQLRVYYDDAGRVDRIVKDYR